MTSTLAPSCPVPSLLRRLGEADPNLGLLRTIERETEESRQLAPRQLRLHVVARLDRFFRRRFEELLRRRQLADVQLPHAEPIERVALDGGVVELPGGGDDGVELAAEPVVVAGLLSRPGDIEATAQRFGRVLLGARARRTRLALERRHVVARLERRQARRRLGRARDQLGIGDGEQIDEARQLFLAIAQTGDTQRLDGRRLLVAHGGRGAHVDATASELARVVVEERGRRLPDRVGKRQLRCGECIVHARASRRAPRLRRLASGGDAAAITRRPRSEQRRDSSDGNEPRGDGAARATRTHAAAQLVDERAHRDEAIVGPRAQAAQDRLAQPRRYARSARSRTHLLPRDGGAHRSRVFAGERQLAVSPSRPTPCRARCSAAPAPRRSRHRRSAPPSDRRAPA